MNVFLTVGTQLPFPRLIRAMDAWAAQPRDEAQLFGQIGQVGPDNPAPEHFDWAEWVAPADFEARVAAADLLVCHAGMGSIITALSAGTPILILPRQAALGEHRNEHQLATAARFLGTPGLYVAEDEHVLPERIAGATQGTRAGALLPPFADDALLGTVRGFIQGEL